jgi:hypothetical protein
MKISKKSGDIVLTKLNQNEVYGLLKCQVPMHLVFMDENNNFFEEKTMTLSERLFDGEQRITVNGEHWEYKALITEIGQIMHSGLYLGVLMTMQDFKDNEPLIALVGSLKAEVVNSCVYIQYGKDVYCVVNRPFANGDHDKLLYYAGNDSILAFVEKGPVLIADNPHVTSVEDVLCNG